MNVEKDLIDGQIYCSVCGRKIGNFSTIGGPAIIFDECQKCVRRWA